MIHDEVLPIGSVVSLKELEGSMLMIVGAQAGTSDGKKFDYMGVRYPIGVTSAQSYVCFNERLIDKVLFKGYEGPKWDNYLKLIEHLKGEDEIV